MPHEAIVATAPGKLILSGEHAVVYGQPAVATAVSLSCQATAWHGDQGLRIEAPGTGFDRQFDRVEDVERLADEAARRHGDFAAGRLPIEAVLASPFDLLACAVVQAARRAGRRLPDGLVLRLAIGPPLGCGMGSSAAAGLALMMAVHGHFSELPALDALVADSLAVERLQHGTPSGVDSFICAHGGTIRYRRGEPAEPLALSLPPLTLVHTGKPATGTGTCVSQVASTHGARGPWAAFGEVTAAMEAALRTNDGASLLAAVRANHRLLHDIGVVPPRVAAFIAEVEAGGGAAKVCGAGAVRGEGGGMVWVVGAAPSEPLCRRYGYTLVQTEGNARGTRLVERFGSR